MSPAPLFRMGLPLFLLAATPFLPQAVHLLDRYDFQRRTARFDLPGRLDEVSGLAFSPDGRLFAHDDERAVVHEIDPETGDVGKRFSLGDPAVRGDFEGIAIAGERFFLIESHGRLYEFREVADRGEAPYRVSDTMLGATCEIEGLDFDAVDDALYVACKVSAPERGVLVVHRLPLDPARGPLPPILIERSELRAKDLDPDFEPSAVALDPAGTIVLASAHTESLIEVDRNGHVLAGVRLSHDRHPQAEGLAFGPEGTLFLADEKNGRDARLTTYAPLSVSERSR